MCVCAAEKPSLLRLNFLWVDFARSVVCEVSCLELFSGFEDIWFPETSLTLRQTVCTSLPGMGCCFSGEERTDGSVSEVFMFLFRIGSICHVTVSLFRGLRIEYYFFRLLCRFLLYLFYRYMYCACVIIRVVWNLCCLSSDYRNVHCNNAMIKRS